jgi:cellulose synthase/poly-beta-1,6-N-acetylglucosamine synthase-like glycosyltransferase
MTAPRVSVVITAHDEALTIGPCLRAVAAQEGFAPGELEIVLVDDRSSDATGEAARATGIAGLDIVRIDRHAATLLTARQVALDTGIARARGDIVILTDADAIPPRDWARHLIAPIERGDADVVAGGVEFVPDGPTASMLIPALQTADAAFYLAVCRLIDALGAESGLLFGNAALRREVYTRVGGFAAIGPALTEDLAFARAAKRHGLVLGFVARPLVAVHACAGWRELVRRARRTSMGGASLLAAALGAWTLSLVALSLGVLAGAVPPLCLMARYLAGAGIVMVALARAGRGSLAPVALLYEPFAIITALRVMWDLRRTRPVEWGGIRYSRKLFGRGIDAA